MTAASGADQPTLRDRYWQCDDTCTVDCGACKGQGRPTLRDQLDENVDDRLADINIRGSIAGVLARYLPGGGVRTFAYEVTDEVLSALLPGIADALLPLIEAREAALRDMLGTAHRQIDTHRQAADEHQARVERAKAEAAAEAYETAATACRAIGVPRQANVFDGYAAALRSNAGGDGG